MHDPNKNPSGVGAPDGQEARENNVQRPHPTPGPRPEQPNAMPPLAAVARGNTADKRTDEWIVHLDFGGYQQMVIVSTRELREYRRFQRACMEQLNRCFAHVGGDEWNRREDEAMRRGQS